MWLLRPPQLTRSECIPSLYNQRPGMTIAHVGSEGLSMSCNDWSKTWLVAIALSGLAHVAQAQPQNPPPQKMTAAQAAQKLGGPTLISLHFNQTSALTVVESLARQAGLAVDPAAVEVLQNQPIASLD